MAFECYISSVEYVLVIKVCNFRKLQVWFIHQPQLPDKIYAYRPKFDPYTSSKHKTHSKHGKSLSVSEQQVFGLVPLSERG